MPLIVKVAPSRDVPVKFTVTFSSFTMAARRFT